MKMPHSDYTLDEVRATYRRYQEGRKEHEGLWKRIDAYESGDMFKTLKKKFPKHQLPWDKNYLAEMKEVKTNSLYAGAYFADLRPRHQTYDEYARQMNKFVEYTYDRMDIGYMQMLAGSCASTKGFGGVLFGWDAEAVDSYTAGAKHVGDMVGEYVDITQIYLDPTVKDYQKGQAVFITDTKTLSELKAKYPVQMEEYFKEKAKGMTAESGSTKEFQVQGTPQDKADMGRIYSDQKTVNPEDKAVAYMRCFFKFYTGDEHRLDELIIIDGDFLLSCKTGIKPNYFPLAVLYSMLPEKTSYAGAPAKKVLTNVLTINILKSIEATHTHAAQRRAMIIRANAGLVPRQVARDAYNPAKVMVTTAQDVNNVLTYIDLPDLPTNLPLTIQRMEQDIRDLTGIDQEYKGRDTGSITTTGGVQQVMERASVVTDNTQVALLERFAKFITKLIVDYYIEFADARDIYVDHRNTAMKETYKIDFPAMKSDSSDDNDENIKSMFEYNCHATPKLPKNRARFAEAANILMEKQMQYQMNPPIITPEEWLSYQDFPQKDDWIDRLRIDQMQNDVEEISSNVMNFSALLQQGVNPDDAVNMMAQEKQLMKDAGALGNTGTANNFQQRQT